VLVGLFAHNIPISRGLYGELSSFRGGLVYIMSYSSSEYAHIVEHIQNNLSGL